MKRRALLATAGTGAVGLAGCIGDLADDPDHSDNPDHPDDAGWTHDVGGRVEAIADGRVFFEEDWGDDTAGDGGVAALDAETGEHLWSYGSSHGYSTFTDLTVADAVYVGYGDDAVGSGSGELYALELDGTERWTFDTGSVYERPRLADGTVYVGSDDGVVRAIDAEDGTLEWRYEVEPDEAGGPPNPSVEAVGDAVYVAAGRLLALDPGTGDPRWQFGDDDSSVRTAAAHEGRVFVRDGHAVRAVEDGEERWSTGSTFESSPRVAVDDGRVFVRAGTGLLRFDDDGTRRWSVDVDHLSAWTGYGDRVYAAGAELFAFHADDGDEIWRESVAEGLLSRLQVADDGDASGGDDHAVFVEEKDETVHRVSPDGAVTGSEPVPGNVRSYVVEDRVYVGSSEGVYAFDPS